MRTDGLFALRSGPVKLPDGESAKLEVHQLGQLRVPSGRLGVCDPLRLEALGVLSIPPGDHRAVATIARVPEEYDVAERRTGYLSLVISDRPTASVHPAVFAEGGLVGSEQHGGGIAGMPGLRGVATSKLSTVAMVDAGAFRRGMPSDPDTWFDTVISPSDNSGWFNRMDTEDDGPLGALITELPGADNGENIAILMARPERLFPVLETRGADGGITGIHIDLLVIGELSESLDAFDGRCEFSAELAADLKAERQAARETSGFFARLGTLFGR